MNKVLTMTVTRLLTGVLTLLLVSAIIFFSIELLPGDLATAVLGQTATPETLQAFRDELGLDRPAVVRYVEWLANAAQGDLGVSLANNRDVGELIADRFGNTLFLAAFAAILAVPLSIVLGVAAALFRNSMFDRGLNILMLGAISFPDFFTAYVLVLFFSIKISIFPSITNLSEGMTMLEMVYRSFLPAVTLALVILSHMTRMARASIINLLAAPYIEMAKLKGVTSARVITVHALPNALAPIINVIALNLGYLITGVVVIEVVFVYSGLGQLMVDSVSKQDVTVVQGCCLVFAVVYILLNLTADALSYVTNPRLLHQR